MAFHDDLHALARHARTNAEAAARDPGDSMPVRAYAVFREVRMLVDGTQIIGPWLAPADQFTEGRQ